MDYIKSEQVNVFQLRWFVENCMEIRLPNGKTIIVDPIFIKEAKETDSHLIKAFQSGFTADDIEGCDYILLTHVHGDHIHSLAEVYEKFHAPVLVNGWSAFPLAKALDLPLGAFIPMTDGEEYLFDGFRLKWLQGRHSPAAGARRPSESLIGDTDAEITLGQMGTIYNSNFILTLDNGMTLAMDGGRYEPNLSNLSAYKPNLVFCHCVKDPEICAANFADALIRSGGEFLLPLCSQNQVKGADKTVELTNQKLSAAGHYGRAINPKPGQWINFSLSCNVN